MPNEIGITKLLWVSRCSVAVLHPQSVEAVCHACVCARTQATYISERHTSHLAYMWCLDLAHTMINIRNVAALHDTGKSVSVFKRKNSSWFLLKSESLVDSTCYILLLSEH